jgi:hypothetical protein
MSALITDFAVGLTNNKRCGTGITESEMIKHLKKVGKSTGYKYFSFTVPKKYLRHIKTTDYCMKEVNGEEYGEEFIEIYKDCVLVSNNKK